jgi:hypothetical protein
MNFLLDSWAEKIDNPLTPDERPEGNLRGVFRLYVPFDIP